MDHTDEQLMGIALEEAEKALRCGEVPVGAVVADAVGAVIARAHNRTVAESDPAGHAEILALRAAGKAVGNYRLVGCTLYVTIEPCCMCAGALVWARIRRLVYGADDPKGGAVRSLYGIPADSRLNHRVEVETGVLAERSRSLMQSFFRARRDDRRKPA